MNYHNILIGLIIYFFSLFTLAQSVEEPQVYSSADSKQASHQECRTLLMEIQEERDKYKEKYRNCYQQYVANNVVSPPPMDNTKLEKCQENLAKVHSQAEACESKLETCLNDPEHIPQEQAPNEFQQLLNDCEQERNSCQTELQACRKKQPSTQSMEGALESCQLDRDQMEMELADCESLRSKVSTCRGELSQCREASLSSVIKPEKTKCTLVSGGKWKELIPSIQIYASRYRVPDFLALWANTDDIVTINKEFNIMTREVSVADFQVYLEETNNSLGKIKEMQKKCPIRGISWKEAKEYADWLKAETGCNVDLPSIDEWLAAIALKAKPEEENVRRRGKSPPEVPPQLACEQPTQEQPIDLLANLQEWSRESCKNGGGYYVVGKNYTMWYGDYRSSQVQPLPNCQTNPLETIGFRLVWRP